MTPQQLAELLLGIARAQAAIVQGLENEMAGVRSGRIIPALQNVAHLRDHPQPTLTDLPVRVLLGTLVAGEALSPNQAGGMALVLVGIVIGQPVAARAVATWRSRRRPTDAAAPASMATSRPVHARP